MVYDIIAAHTAAPIKRKLAVMWESHTQSAWMMLILSERFSNDALAGCTRETMCYAFCSVYDRQPQRYVPLIIQ